MQHSRNKRQKEFARQEHQKQKEAKKEERKKAKTEQDAAAKAQGIDPDIAHIIPGPQPLPE